MRIFRISRIVLSVLLVGQSFVVSSNATDVWSLCDAKEQVGGEKKQVMKISVLNAAKAVYGLSETDHTNMDGKTVQTSLKSKVNANIDGYWDKVKLFRTAVNSKLTRSGPHGDTTDPFKAPLATYNYFGLLRFKGDRVIIAFQGTDSWDGAKVDVSFHQVTTKEFHSEKTGMQYIKRFFNTNEPKDEGNTYIHRGILRAALSSQAEIIEHFKKHNFTKPEVVVTGHSLGGGMALVFAASLHSYLEEEFPDRGEPATKQFSLNVVTFGAPMVFNTLGCQTFESKIGCEHTGSVITTGKGLLGLTEFDDPVTGLPWSIPMTSEYDYIVSNTKRLKTGYSSILLYGATIHSMKEYEKHF